MNMYNDIDPFCREWLARLVAGGHVADGQTYEGSLQDMVADPYTVTMLSKHTVQAHFFAGIGVWSYALRRAGWPDTLPVWTGSCPCQPFSNAGSRKGLSDERHLWPAWFGLIQQCRPPVIFGEQVASPDGLGWLDAVQADLEGAGYAVGAADLSAAGVGAPHIRSRLYWVAIADVVGQQVVREARLHADGQAGHDLARRSTAGRLGDTAGPRCEGRALGGQPGEEVVRLPGAPDGQAGGVGDTRGDRDQQHAGLVPRHEGQHVIRATDSDYASVTAGAVGGPWAGCDWVYCQDGRYRPVEPGTFPLADGPATRVGRLRAYGNALCAEQAVTFIRAVMEAV